MIPAFIIKLLAFGIILIILINVLLYKLIVAAVLRKYIKPYLYAQNLIFQHTKFVGLLNQGDFGKWKFVVKPVAEMGNISNTTFFYVHAIDDKGAMHQYTLKVSTIFLFISKVILKSKKENIEIELPRST